MENASKALIIAGAILLSILIIAIGMYIYNSSQNSISGAGSQISAYEIQSFNQTWEMYEGVQTGTNVRALISKMSANAKSNETEKTRLPDLCYEPSDGTVKRVVSKVKVNESSEYSPQGKVGFTFDTARQLIEPRHEYHVFLVQDSNTSLISVICVAYDSITLDKFKEKSATVATALAESL